MNIIFIYTDKHTAKQVVEASRQIGSRQAGRQVGRKESGKGVTTTGPHGTIWLQNSHGPRPCGWGVVGGGVGGGERER